LTRCLRDAVAARELKPCDTAEFARLIQQLNVRQVNGLAPLDWAVYRKGPLAAWIRRSLECPARPLSRQEAHADRGLQFGACDVHVAVCP
jgi:hypothetical protein